MKYDIILFYNKFKNRKVEFGLKTISSKSLLNYLYILLVRLVVRVGLSLSQSSRLSHSEKN